MQKSSSDNLYYYTLNMTNYYTLNIIITYYYITLLLHQNYTLFHSSYYTSLHFYINITSILHHYTFILLHGKSCHCINWTIIQHYSVSIFPWLHYYYILLWSLLQRGLFILIITHFRLENLQMQFNGSGGPWKL